MRVWINGELLSDPSAPAVRVTDHGLTVGDGVFEAIKVVDGSRSRSRGTSSAWLGRRAGSASPTSTTTPYVGVAAVLADQELPLGRIGSPTPTVRPMGSDGGTPRRRSSSSPTR